MRALIAAVVLLAAPAGVDMKKISSHLRDHQAYPASKAELLASCFDLQDFTAEEKKWFIATLPNGKYASAAQVVAALAKK